MRSEEWIRAVEAANRDVAGFLRAQQTIASVREELGHRSANPKEEDRIFRDGYGAPPGEPRLLNFDGVRVEARVLHRKGLQQNDIQGADLMYEIADRKFLLIQYKDADTRGRVKKDSRQLDRLIQTCPAQCLDHVSGAWPICGSWYSVHSAGSTSYMPACHAERVFGAQASSAFGDFRDGLPMHIFHDLFARCFIGARIAPTDMVYHTWAALEADHVVFNVVQRGTFGL